MTLEISKEDTANVRHGCQQKRCYVFLRQMYIHTLNKHFYETNVYKTDITFTLHSLRPVRTSHLDR